MKSLFLRIRLWRIERALGIKLWPNQRDFVLNGNPDILSGGRRNGKTVAANARTILYRKEPVYNSQMLGREAVRHFSAYPSVTFIPNDSDWSKNESRHIKELARCVQACYDAGIETFRMEVKPGVWIGGKPKFRISRKRYRNDQY